MERSGHAMAKLPVSDPRELLGRIARSPASFEAEKHAPGRYYVPILQDLLLGKPTEARELNKRVVDLGAAEGLELPWNWRTYQKATRLATMGFYRDPYSNFGRLVYEMWRAARLVVDTGLHYLDWTRQQAIDYLAENTALSLSILPTRLTAILPGQANL